MSPQLLRRHGRGLTLIEVMLAIAVTAILTSLALPSFSAMLQRHRLASAAETLAADLAEARFQAAESGLTWHLHVVTGPQGCYAVSRQPDCDCSGQSTCAVKAVTARDWPGVVLDQGDDTRFDPTAVLGQANALRWQAARGGDSLVVRLSPMGRASVCSTSGQTRGYPAC